MACLPYFKFYPRDWLADVLDLTLAERGAYITFLAWSWRKDEPLPLEEERRAAILGVPTRELRSIWRALEPYWEQTPVGYINPRLEAERQKARSRSASSRAAAEARWSANAHTNGGAPA